MTREAIEPFFDRARQVDVSAQTFVGQLFLEGKYIQANRENAIGWLRNVGQCNCHYVRDFLDDMLGQPSILRGNIKIGRIPNLAMFLLRAIRTQVRQLLVSYQVSIKNGVLKN